MTKNRDYTGLERTPSSMAWLIRMRSTRKGQLDRLLALQQKLPNQILQVQQELMAIDAVMPLHEVTVNPAMIAGKRPRRKALAPYGEVTRLIFRCLRAAKGKAVNTLEITYFFAREAGLDPNQIGHQRLTDCVARRLLNCPWFSRHF